MGVCEGRYEHSRARCESLTTSDGKLSIEQITTCIRPRCSPHAHSLSATWRGPEMPWRQRDGNCHGSPKNEKAETDGMSLLQSRAGAAKRIQIITGCS